ncbi:hypothetical protein BKH43_02475 [Helicobacter sp. 13S00401-1]|uniref:hypothetical protein n=1 Tax=Helicobacter sp. 13S00401-1 TaxID=1905758 RepID=UPI000BA582AE|nr:hypothetical protein [Helicobacter sp. 13S00401-1]PAF51091.1 hypothetical protein BKH43_02475 [Helicobacter sp. 13S00401-1]
MKWIKPLLLIVACSSFLLAQKIDPETGLKVDKGLTEVKQNCTVCHSAAFIIEGKGTRQEWKETIVWMQKTQGLWDLDPKTEDLILTYLAKNYPQVATSLRRPLLEHSKLPK